MARNQAAAKVKKSTASQRSSSVIAPKATEPRKKAAAKTDTQKKASVNQARTNGARDPVEEQAHGPNVQRSISKSARRTPSKLTTV